MADIDDDVSRLNVLVRDLVALKENRLTSPDRLIAELDVRIDDFRNLLDNPPRNDNSRKKLESGKIEIDGQAFEVNKEFQNQALKLANDLELDELEAAKLFLTGQQESALVDRTPYATSVIHFYRRRNLIIQALRLLFEQSLTADLDLDSEDAVLELEDPAQIQASKTIEVALGNCKTAIRAGPQGKDGTSVFWSKCFNAMGTIEKSLQKLSNQEQRILVVDGETTPEVKELFEYQMTTLMSQHECLGALCSYLVRDSFCSLPDFKLLVAKLRMVERHDIILVHHFPIIMAFTYHFGRPESSLSDEDLKFVHTSLITIKDSPWNLRSLQAAIMVIWLASYSGRDFGIEQDVENATMPPLFSESLKEGSFHFLLSLCKDIQNRDWPDFGAAGLLSVLLQDAPVLPSDSRPVSSFMSNLISKYMQRFINSLITNMPDSLRMLKAEEDENRRLLQSRYQQEQNDYDAHLERFLIMISYAYRNFPVAALDFWSSTDGNLYGFLRWSAERQTTPRAAAFCELLISLSQSDECANHTHVFLHENGSSFSGRLRRSSALSWAQILREVEFYSTFVQDRQNAGVSTAGMPYGTGINSQLVEPESHLLVECYLRLIAHLCKYSPEAKKWLLVESKFPMSDVLFQLSSSGTETRLRAASFQVFTAMLSDKTADMGKSMWVHLDQWIYSTNRWQTYLRLDLSRNNELAPFVAIANTVEEADAFVDLLNALMAPIVSEDTIHDALPFPESLGSSYRLPGIDNYIDFAVGKLFGELSSQIDSAQQQQILRCKCLNLIATCLSTFNDDLVLIAMLSNIKVDSVIQTSSLKAYIRLHPFARVMEWLFNDQVLQTLFQTAHQDINTVTAASEDSPLVKSLTKSIEIMHLITKLQSTYLDFVRTFPKTDDNKDPPPQISSSTLASFEDAVLNHLDIVVDLGLYAGTSHQKLATESLKVLEKLSSSRKLIATSSNLLGPLNHEKSKIISIVEKDHEDFRIANALAGSIEFDEQEWEAGPDVPAYQLKIHILDFLLKGLKAVSDTPTLSHILLGFTSSGNALTVADDSLFSSGNSLFHIIMRLGTQYPYAAPGADCISSWMSAVRFKCAEILRALWRSRLTSSFAMIELRACDYAFATACQNLPISSHTLWDDSSIDNQPDFFLSSGASALASFLGQRAVFYDYCARELRLAKAHGMSAHLSRMQSMLLGMTAFPDDETISTLSIFDLFDFVELDLPTQMVMPPLQYFEDLDFSICEIADVHAGRILDQHRVEEMLSMRVRELINSGRVTTKNEDDLNAEYFQLLAYTHASNSLTGILASKRDCLRSWISLLAVFLEICDLAEAPKTQFILQAFKVITPKLERALSTSMEVASALIGACRPLMRHIDPKVYDKYKHSGDASNDMLFQLFRVALTGITHIDSTAEFRESCEQVAYVYIRNIAASSPPVDGGASTLGKDSIIGRSLFQQSTSTPGATGAGSNALARNVIRILRLNSDRLIEVLCDDVQFGSGMSRIPAVLLLDSMVLLASRERSDFVIEAMARLNFLGLLVDFIKHIPRELGSIEQSLIPQLLMCYNTILALILRICSTRAGATHILSLGLFPAVRESAMFSTDPDVGLDVENPHALRRFFQLMLALMRIINTAVVSRGTHNERVIQQAREFLVENRASIVSILKRRAGIGRAMSLLDESATRSGANLGSTLRTDQGNGGSGSGSAGGAAADAASKEAIEKIKRKDTEMISELVDNFVLLITVTDFIEFEEETTTGSAGVPIMFS